MNGEAVSRVELAGRRCADLAAAARLLLIAGYGCSSGA
jgi:hypothetical protein